MRQPAPSVASRMASFQDGIEKMLWPEKRDKDPVLGDKVPGLIDRTTTESYIRIASGYLPGHLQNWGPWLLPRLFKDDVGFELGPIPRGTPVSLIANLLVRPEEMNFLDSWRHKREVAPWSSSSSSGSPRSGRRRRIPPSANPTARAPRTRFARSPPGPMRLSKCPDYLVNRGHYFGTGHDDEPGLSDTDKRALIEFLKTF